MYVEFKMKVVKEKKKEKSKIKTEDHKSVEKPGTPLIELGCPLKDKTVTHEYINDWYNVKRNNKFSDK